MPDSPRWSPPTALPPSAAGEVHVWRTRLDADPDTVAALRDLLSLDERERAACYRFGRDRDAFIVARGTLRLVLSRYLGIAPEAVAFAYGAHGKPELAAGSELATSQRLEFNLSHAGAWALVAVARGRQLGVDLEPVRALPDADAIVERFFSAAEVAAYRAVPAPDRPAAFFACWTRKEAFVKAVGDGLAFPLADFDVTVRPHAPPALLRVRGHDTPPEWHLDALQVEAGYAATVAVAGAPCEVTCWDAAPLVASHLSAVLEPAS